MLEVKGVSKHFGALCALDHVSATFLPGRIHAVLGENGAGKSTLMSVLAGFLVPEQGDVVFEGTSIPGGRPAECQRLGIEMIHQHFTLVPAFTAEENLALARTSQLVSKVDPRSQSLEALEIAAKLGWDIPRNQRTSELPVGVQQRLEILKALSGSAKVLIFDEPTAVLSPEEAEDLFRVMRTLRDEGRILILIAHKLSEVLSVADEVTVLRRGINVASAPITDVTAQILAEWMVGDLPPMHTEKRANRGAARVRATGMSVLGDRGETAIRDVKFEIRAGEIYGFGGVDGNGQIELAEALVGLRRPIRQDSLAVETDRDIGYIPQDRQHDGLALELSVRENLLLTGVRDHRLRRGPFLRLRKIQEWSRKLIQKFSIKTEGPDQLVKSLSGGNQQKIVVSRVFDQVPEVIIAVNPTRGLDIKATHFVHAQLLSARERGAAIALISTDLDELTQLSDRLAFLSRGELVEGEGSLALLGEGSPS